VLVGPHTFNFEEGTLTLIRQGGGERVASAEQLGGAVIALLRDGERRQRMGQCAREVFDGERGAVQRVLRLIDNLLRE